MKRRRPYLRPIAADSDLGPLPARREVAPDGDAPAVREAATGSSLPVLRRHPLAQARDDDESAGLAAAWSSAG